MNSLWKQMDILEAWRLNAALPYVRGRLLDIGCGYNNLVRAYGSGIGVDIHPWNGIDAQIGNGSALPFPDSAFETVSIVAALNHIPNREAALREVWRVLRADGRLLVTMIGPLTGVVAHVLFRQDEAVRGGLGAEELKGMGRQQVRDLLAKSRFAVAEEHRFQLGLNTLFVAHKRVDA